MQCQFEMLSLTQPPRSMLQSITRPRILRTSVGASALAREPNNETLAIKGRIYSVDKAEMQGYKSLPDLEETGEGEERRGRKAR